LDHVPYYVQLRFVDDRIASSFVGCRDVLVQRKSTNPVLRSTFFLCTIDDSIDCEESLSVTDLNCCHITIVAYYLWVYIRKWQ